MGRDIELPWTCETADKIKKALGWICLIGFPMLTIYSIFSSIYNTQNEYNLGLVWTGLMGTVISWSISYLSNFIEFPTFKCKSKKDESN